MDSKGYIIAIEMAKADKIKILFIHHGTGIGGAPISLLNLIKQLDKTKFSLKVAFVKGGVAEELFKKNGITTEVIDSSNNWFTHNETGKIQWQYFYRYFNIYRDWKNTAKEAAPSFLKKQKVDIVHLNSHVLSSWASAANSLGYKVVMHNRETVAEGYFGVRRSILQGLIRKNVDAVINISEDNRDRLGLEGKSYVVYNFVQLPKQYRVPMTVRHPRKVLYLGGQAKIKGFSTAVNCLPFLNKDIQVQFAGNYGRLQAGKGINERLKNWAKLHLYRTTYRPLKDLMDAPNAELLGLLIQPLPIIDNCDILITPFSVEHFSRPAMEAMAYGKPVIGSDVEGMDEIIDHGETGLLVEKNNPKALAEAINYLCAHPDIAQKMGRKGRQKAERLFSPEKNTAKVEAIYEKLMEDKHE